MNKHLTATFAAGAAALGLAAPAMGASLPLPTEPRFDVPAGKIEQTVQIDQVSGPNAIASHTKTLQWLTSDRSHTIVIDVATGRVKAETVATPTEIRTYNADEKVVRIERRRRAGHLPANSFTFEQAVQRAYLEQGYVRVIGEQQVDGRRALVTENVAGGRWRSDPADSRTVAVVDAETFTLYERTTTHPRGDFVHSQQFPVNRVIDATPENVRATMAMKPRPKVRVVGRAASATVPAGQVEHTVVVRRVEGTRAVSSHERTERWLTATRSRTVVTDLKTGKVRAEIVTTPTETRIKEGDRVTVRRHKAAAAPYTTAARDAEIQREQLEQGVTRIAGEKTVAGRRALVLESVPGKWRSSEPSSRTVAVVDAETFAIYERTTGLPGGEFSQTEVHELTELLPVAKAKLGRR
jgi:hypothetical protein